MNNAPDRLHAVRFDPRIMQEAEEIKRGPSEEVPALEQKAQRIAYALVSAEEEAELLLQKRNRLADENQRLTQALQSAVKEIDSYANSDVGSCRLALRILLEHVPEAFP